MSFWDKKRVLITGHTGFKGSWLSLWLRNLGASVYGLALEPNTEPSLFRQLELATQIDHKIGDICDGAMIGHRLKETRPDVVFHLAAQSLVLESYKNPIANWMTNILGMVNLLDALRDLDKPCAAIMVTTDKVYENKEWPNPYRENDRLGGNDPYAASKAACELAISSYRTSYFQDHNVVVASARAGNVIGGGDWAANRIVPDIVRALMAKQSVPIRNLKAKRPWQHVLEPLSGYLRLAEQLYTGKKLACSYNFGPETHDIQTVKDLVEHALVFWPGRFEAQSGSTAPYETGLLGLGIELARSDLKYQPRWDFATGLEKTISWYRSVHSGAAPLEITQKQIQEFGEP